MTCMKQKTVYLVTCIEPNSKRGQLLACKDAIHSCLLQWKRCLYLYEIEDTHIILVYSDLDIHVNSSNVDEGALVYQVPYQV